MKKKIKIKSLYLVVIGDIITTKAYSKKYVIQESTPIIAHAKYSFFNKGIIKYFINILDNTKYFTKELYQYTNSLCALRYCPLSILLSSEELKRGYIYEDDIKKYLNSYFGRKFIEETKNLLDDSPKKNITEYDEIKPKLVKKENETYSKNYYTILTSNKFNHEPVIGRDKELANLKLTLVQMKNNPLLIGQPGVGKTVLIQELAYMIQKGNVPNILKDRIIIETSAGEILSGTRYRGEMEERLLELSKIVKESNAILFIDNFHNVLKSGSNEDSGVDIASILKKMIDRDNIKVIGSTTRENYNKFISTNDLKDRFEVITVEEPDEALLYDIISYTLDNYSKTLNIRVDNINENIINILIELTRKKHRRYNDCQNNPRLVIGIIDKAFGAASAEDSRSLNYNHLIQSIQTNEKIYDSKKEEIIRKIELLSENKKNKDNIKILKLTR